ncbi:MAG: OmpA family protein [Gemmatimonadaceae bacterium]|nr:OmpA family protein [Gemmatimonadaceae bacterium]
MSLEQLFRASARRGRQVLLAPALVVVSAHAVSAQTVASQASDSARRDTAPATRARDVAASGMWANYDFVPGNRPLYVNDFSADVVGDFPSRLRWGQGTFEIVQTQGARFLRATSSGWFAIPLAERLPERFTLELQLSATGGWNQEIFFGPAARGARQPHLIVSQHASGVIVGDAQTLSRPARDVRGAVFPVRVMVDGAHAKVFIGETRVVNVPTIDLGRDREIRVQVRAQQGAPVLIGDVRVMAGGKDLYDALAADGRVATQGILFESGSDVVKPESGPTLKAISTMLAAHPALRLSIDGHTDNVGDAKANAGLSERRAAAVRATLSAQYGVDESRLSIRGLGASAPVQPNTTPEGRHANRRVELVRQ